MIKSSSTKSPWDCRARPLAGTKVERLKAEETSQPIVPAKWSVERQGGLPGLPSGHLVTLHVSRDHLNRYLDGLGGRRIAQGIIAGLI